MTNSQKKIVMLLSGLVVLFVMIVGISYAYYVADIKGNKTETPSLVLRSGYLAITYTDGTSELTGGSSGNETTDLVYTKTFDVKNDGVGETYYSVAIKNYKVKDASGNDTVLTLPEYWTYDIKADNTSIASGQLPTEDSVIMEPRLIAANQLENLTLTITFDYSETEDQSADMNKTVELDVSVVQTKIS